MTEYKDLEPLLTKVDEMVSTDATYWNEVISALGEIACHCLKRMVVAYNNKIDRDARREADMFLWDALSIVDDNTNVVREFMADINSDIKDEYELKFSRRG